MYEATTARQRPVRKPRGQYKHELTPENVLKSHSDEDKLDRERCYTDLFFLCKDILGYDLLNEYTHRPVCNFFVQKDRSKSFIDQDRTKRRLLLYPRHSFKSTLNIADCIQWIINFPDDTRILILTAADDLANAFVEEVKQNFVWDFMDVAPRFQWLFPEFCIKPTKKKDNATGEFTIPNRTKYFKEPTIWSSSVTSNLSGWHPTIGKLDDVVSDRNSGTIENSATVTKRIHLARKLLKPGGYWEMIGTRYSDFEAYADALEKSGKELLTLCKPAMWLTADPKHHVTPDDLRDKPESAWSFLFPEMLDYKFLIKEFKDDELSFFSQYMNDPLVGGNITLTIDDMRRATIPAEMVPVLGPIRWTWDMAYSTMKGRDFTAGIGARHSNGRITIVDAERGRWGGQEVANKIVHAAMRWDQHTAAIEDSVGMKFLEEEILRVAAKANWEFYVEWVPIERQANDKAKRFESMQPLILDGRIQFAANCPFLDVIYKEFCNFNNILHKDMADAASRQMRYLVYEAQVDPIQQEKVRKSIIEREHADMVYGRGKYAPKEELNLRANPWGLEDILGGLNG